ncbi:ligand-binding sensor domain-containing protein [Siphonobacter aquaeclarae]|nr:sensor histidine kinase [Siphonobacter aquaeclarae]
MKRRCSENVPCKLKNFPLLFFASPLDRYVYKRPLVLGETALVPDPENRNLAAFNSFQQSPPCLQFAGRMLVRSRLLLLFFLLTGLRMPLTVRAQETAHYSVRHYTDENGLPQNSIKGLAVGSGGFLWVATEAGLARFDGQRIQAFSKDILKTRSDRLFGLSRMVQGGALVGITEHGEILRIHAGKVRYDSATVIDRPFIRLLRLPEKTLAAAIPASSGRYFVFLPGKVALIDKEKVLYQRGISGKSYFEPFPSEPNMRNRVIRQNRKVVCSDNFFSLGGELYYHLYGEGDQFLRFRSDGQEQKQLLGAIRQDPLFARQKEKIRLFQNRCHGQVFAVLGNNLYRVIAEKDGSLTTQILISGFDMEEHLISTMLYDEASRVVFLGSFSKGLFVLRQNSFQTFLDTVNKDFHNVFYAQVPLKNGGIMIPEGLIVKENRVETRLLEKLKVKGAFGRFNMVKARDGNVWIQDGRSIVRVDPASGSIRSMVTFRDAPANLYQGFDDGIWLGFRTGKVGYISAKGIYRDSVFSTGAQIGFQCQDIPGRHWFGTTRGLFVASLARRKLAFVGLEGAVIRSLYASAPGVLWITTYGDGIYLFHNGHLRRIQSDTDGFLNHAHCIAEDRNGDFWISTNKGLFRAHKADMLAYAEGRASSVFYVYYNRSDGFITNEFNGGCQPCMAKLADGRFSFPSINGLVWFRPESVPIPDLSSPFFIDHISIDGADQPVADSLRLPSDYQYVNFGLTTPLFHNGENLLFQYRIQKRDEPGEGRWIKADPDQSFRLYTFAPGDYVLTIQKVTGFQGKYLEKKIFIHIPTPWYLSAWFWLAALLMLVVLIRAYIHWRFLRLKRQNEALREKVDERTRHLSRALDDVRKADAALETQLQIQLRIISALNHDLLTPLRFLNKTLPVFVDRVNNAKPDSLTAQIGLRLRQSTGKVVDFADNLLKFTKATYLQNDGLLSDDVEVRTILRAKAIFFEEIAEESQTRIVVLDHGPVKVATREQMLEIVIHNLIDNALKHTYGSTLTLQAMYGPNRDVLITVADTGSGMPAEIVEWLNFRFSEQNENLAPRVPVNLGLGLIIVKEITDLLGVRLEVVSGSDGTIVTLWLT